MRSPAFGILMLALCCVLGGLELSWEAGCSSTPTPMTPLQATEVLSYGQQELACVTESGTRAQADACIAAVKAQWCSPGAPLQQQGACGDAGPEASIPMGPVLERVFGLSDGGKTPTAATGAATVGVTPADAGGH